MNNLLTYEDIRYCCAVAYCSGLNQHKILDFALIEEITRLILELQNKKRESK